NVARTHAELRGNWCLSWRSNELETRYSPPGEIDHIVASDPQRICSGVNGPNAARIGIVRHTRHGERRWIRSQFEFWITCKSILHAFHLARVELGGAVYPFRVASRLEDRSDVGSI